MISIVNKPTLKRILNKLGLSNKSSKVKPKKVQQIKIVQKLIRALPLKAFGLCLFLLNFFQSPPALALWGSPTCDVEVSDRILKDNLRKSNTNISSNLATYQALLTKHKDQLIACRNKDPIKTQALWLRLYPKDAKSEVLDDVLDRIVNRGYSTLFVEVFYDGRILLPVSDNPTPWRSLTEEAVKSGQVTASYDLWAEVIRKGRERGLKVYGVSFGLNFGYSYGQDGDRNSILARNGAGETSIVKSQFDPKSNLVANGQAFYLDATEADRLFIDPYNLQAKSDFSGAIAALVKRQPDGILFDYLRYPNRQGLVNNVKDLWIYGEAARKSLLEAMPDRGTRELMAIFLDAGKVTPEAIASLQENILQENNSQKSKTQKSNSQKSKSQNSSIQNNKGIAQARSKNPVLAAQVAEKILWQLAVNHAYQGILSFVDEAIATVNSTVNTTVSLSKNADSKIAIGAVFFPNVDLQKTDRKTDRKLGAYDPRLQPWDRFPKTMERHPMTYAICDDGKCVANEVIKVLKSSPQSKVCPVLAGTWGKSLRGHPSFEIQMQAIKAVAPQISCVSHFVYGWIEPESDRDRKAGL